MTFVLPDVDSDVASDALEVAPCLGKKFGKVVNSSAVRRMSQHLMLVECRCPDRAPKSCGLIWQDGLHIYLVSPHLGAVAFEGSPPNACHKALGWLSGVCNAVSDLSQVQRACDENPQWRLTCVRCDANNVDLSGLTRLIQVAEKIRPVPLTILRVFVLQIVRKVLDNNLDLSETQIEATFHEGDDVAVLRFALGRPMLVRMMRNLPWSNRVGHCTRVPDSVSVSTIGWERCVLVLPGIELDQPEFMSPRVVKTNLLPANVHAAIICMSNR